MNVIHPGAFLTLHYRLAGPQGDVVNTFAGPPATLTLGTGSLAPALEQRLLGLAEGARATFELPEGEVFGQRNPDMIQWLPRKELDELDAPDAAYAVAKCWSWRGLMARALLRAWCWPCAAMARCSWTSTTRWQAAP